MNKENIEASKLEVPTVRITRARAKVLGASGRQIQKPSRPEQKRVFQANSKRAASYENKPSYSAAACTQNKRRAVLVDVSNVVGKKSHVACFNASTILKCQTSKQLKKPTMGKNSKVVPAVVVESPCGEDAKHNIDEDISKLKVETGDATLPIKGTVATGTVDSGVDHCEVASPPKVEDYLKTHSSDSASHQRTDAGPVEPKFKWPRRFESLFKKDGKLDGKSETSIHPKIVDIDSNHKDPQMCSVYASDIYDHICVTELNQRPSVDYMEKVQPDITQSMRGILIDWLVEVSEEYRLVPDTLYLTVNLIDRFLSQSYIEKQRLQLLGITCMLIAAKYEEISAPRVEEFCFVTDNTYMREEVVKMERQVLNLLCFQLSVPTTKTFLRRFVQAAQATCDDPSVDLEYLANYLAELTLVEYSFLKYLPSLIAASAVFLAVWTLDQSVHPWNPTLEYHTRYKPPELKVTVLAMEDLQSNMKGCTLNAIREKYRQKKFNCVANLLSLKPVQTLFTG